MTQPHFERIHPLTILVEGWRAITRLLFIIVVAVFNSIQGEGSSAFGEVLLSGLGLLVAVQAVFRYLSYKFAIHEGALLVKEGLFFKKDRTIPLERIQNINLRRDLIHRILGLTDVEVETAAGAKAEATISAVSEEQAHRLKERLSGSYDPTASPILIRRDEEVIYSISPRELFLAGATENKLLVIIASLFGLLAIAPQLQENALKGAVQRAANEAAHGFNGYLTLVGLGVGALFFGWLASIVMAFITYYRFEVTFHNGRFRRSYGLLNNYENVVPVRRIQIVRVTENFIQRWLKVQKLYMDTAGAFSGKEGDGQRNQSARPTPLMAPMIATNEVARLISRVLPGAKLDAEGWSRISKKTVPKQLWATVPWALLLAGPTAFLIHWWSAAIFAAVMLIGWIVAGASYRRTRWLDDGDILHIQKGFLWKSLLVIPIDKVQTVEVDQGIVQRWLGLATVTVATAASQHKFSSRITDLEKEEAAILVEKLHARSAVNSWKNPDGF